eukprot:Sdes_comp10446_c0_seq1m2137
MKILEEAMRILIIDNYDSYTFNLVELFGKLTTYPPIVIQNDQIPFAQLEPTLKYFDAVVISPGPGSPIFPHDVGVCLDVIASHSLPILGVCLGHQALAYHFGGKINHAHHLMHGQLSHVFHDETDSFDSLFYQIPSPFSVVRYHSLIVSDPVPSPLQVTSRTADTHEIMSLKHSSFPLWGVQFHPESICTEFGDVIALNFLRLAKLHNENAGRNINLSDFPAEFSALFQLSLDPHTFDTFSSMSEPNFVPPKSKYSILVRKLNFFKDSHSVFRRLYSKSCLAFWLDSSKVEQKLSRFSFMGDGFGPHAYHLKYFLNKRLVQISRPQTSCNSESNPNFCIRLETLKKESSFFDFLQNQLENYPNPPIVWENGTKVDHLPFDFHCGFVGFFSYEMRFESGLFENIPTSPQVFKAADSKCGDSSFLFADRTVVFDHQQQEIYLLGMMESSPDSVLSWMNCVEEILLQETSDVECGRDWQEESGEDSLESPQEIRVRLRHNEKEYHENINRCMDHFHEGDSYEICLTTMLTSSTQLKPFRVYSCLRNRNPAPYGAYLRFDEKEAILSSSPERFLKIDSHRKVEIKPIKGTTPRGKTLEDDETLREGLGKNPKDFAENLMILDLIRNDLSKVCTIGTISVPSMMKIETYSTVHQLVSTVSGTLSSNVTSLKVLQSVFPAGSMTGAPKFRTMGILDELERHHPRGVYSGCLGFFSLTGPVDFAVVIRTIVVDQDGFSIGAGGAIVHLSDSDSEFQEMVLKARAPLSSILDSFQMDPSQLFLDDVNILLEK